MPIYRPSNTNKRLVGTAGTTGGTPGNGGQIGETKTPYCIPKPPATIELGKRYCGGGGSCCPGVYRLRESNCGVNECCSTPPGADYKGFMVCCGPSTCKWFVAPKCTEVVRNWYGRGDSVTVANNCMGSCGWFNGDPSQLVNLGASCRLYWDDPKPSGYYWSNQEVFGAATAVELGGGGSANFNRQDFYTCVRAFRSTNT